MTLPPPATLFPYTTLFRSDGRLARLAAAQGAGALVEAQTALVLGPRVALVTACLEDRQHKGGLRLDERAGRSEEHTSELQSLRHLVCRLLLEKQNTDTNKN